MSYLRKYDILIWGASGFTGQLVAEYLVKNYPSDINLALGGRNKYEYYQNNIY